MARGRDALGRRWLTAGGRTLRLAVQRRISGGEGLDGLGLGAVDGRVDLRGIPFTADFAVPAGVELQHVDLAGANVANLGVLDGAITDCRFDGADCQFWRLRGTAVVDTSFDKADLRRSSLGEWHEGRGNHYRRVSFRSARLRGATTSAATYEDCDFSHAELDRVNFWQSSLVRCVFAGPVRDVVFDGRLLGEGKPDANPMADVDFTGAVFDGCDFRGVTFDSVRLPDAPHLVLISDRDMLARAAASLPEGEASTAVMLARTVLRHVDDELARGGTALLNLRDVGEAADVLGPLLRNLDQPS